MHMVHKYTWWCSHDRCEKAVRKANKGIKKVDEKLLEMLRGFGADDLKDYKDEIEQVGKLHFLQSSP